MLMMPTVYTREGKHAINCIYFVTVSIFRASPHSPFLSTLISELDYDLVVGDQVVTPSYDPHCASGEVSGGCEPVAVISAEKLRDHSVGPDETTKIAEVLMNDPKISQYVIESEAWHCIWDELIVKGKGLKTVYDRPGGLVEDSYNFSAEMLDEMIHELDRLIAKYSSDKWNTKATANRLVELLSEHRTLIQVELDEVVAGVRKLTDHDFLGPRERQRRKNARLRDARRHGQTTQGVKDWTVDSEHIKFFNDMNREHNIKKREQMKIAAMARYSI